MSRPSTSTAACTRTAHRGLRRSAAALAVSAGAPAALLTAAPAAQAAPSPAPYPVGTSMLIRCHGLDLWSVSGYLQSSGTKTKTAPTVTMKGPDGTLYALVGSWSISSRFNGVYYSGKYTYDETLTAPDGSVWGTWKGTQLLDMWGRPYGPKYGTCNNPL